MPDENRTLLEQLKKEDVNEALLKCYITEVRGIHLVGEIIQKTLMDKVASDLKEIGERCKFDLDFQNAFLKSISGKTNQKSFMDAMGIEDDNWKWIAIYLFAQAMLHYPDVHLDRIVDKEQVDKTAQDYVEMLNDRMFCYFYKFYVETYYLREYMELLNDTFASRQRYIDILKSSITIHEMWYSAGEGDSSLTIFLHIMKLLALGLKDIEVTKLLHELKELGLDEICEDFLKGDWYKYTGYMLGKPIIAYTDIQDIFPKLSYYNTEPPFRFLIDVLPLISK